MSTKTLSKTKEKTVVIHEGTLVIPVDYNHDTQIDNFKRKYKKQIAYLNPDFSDEHYANASTKLIPGKEYVIKVITLGTNNDDQLFEHLAEESAIFVGGQGLTLAQDLCPNVFPEGCCVYSFDKDENLFMKHNGPWVPFAMRKGEKWDNYVGPIHTSTSHHYFLCFYEM